MLAPLSCPIMKLSPVNLFTCKMFPKGDFGPFPDFESKFRISTSYTIKNQKVVKIYDYIYLYCSLWVDSVSSVPVHLKHSRINWKWSSHHRLPACFVSRDLVIECIFPPLIRLTRQYKYLFLCVNTCEVLLIKGATMTAGVNWQGLEVILMYIQRSSKCIAGLDMFTYPNTSGSQLVQSMFTLQHR